MQKIVTHLWFDNNAEEAMKFYTSIFKDAKIKDITQYQFGEPYGNVLVGAFELEGQEFMCLNGGPMFKFNESISLLVRCKDQDEVDYFWEKFTANGGEESQCGWLKDRFGLSWQIVPDRLDELLNDSDKEKAGRAFNAMLEMQKLDVATLESAFNGG